MMNTLATLYPPLHLRPPIPPLYLPLTFLLTLLPFLTAHPRLTSLFIFPLLLTLSLLAPTYTFGSPSADYYNTSLFFALPIWFLEFAIFRPVEGGDAPVYIYQGGRRRGEEAKWGDLKSVWEKLAWTAKLMVPGQRGVGWNWGIANVPEDIDSALEKWRYVRRKVWRSGRAYAWSVCMLGFMGWVSAVEKDGRWEEGVRKFLIDAVIGWAGAFWILGRLQCFYSACAAVSVAVGLCEKWQWPPLVGSVRDAWSVGRVWGGVYHQTMRVMVSQPAVRITRFLGLRKGSVASRLLQLYISFGISCLLHQYQMFNVTRKDMGEFAFFMSQPVAITFEVIVQSIWRKSTRGKKHGRLLTIIGYVWVAAWMSWTLPWYVKGFRDAGITADAIFGGAPVEIGGLLYLRAKTYFQL